MNLSVVLGGMLVVTIASTAWYIDYQADQISTLKGNEIVLETQIYNRTNKRPRSRKTGTL